MTTWRPPADGHGHVTPRADKQQEPCGGPETCPVCWEERRAYVQAHDLPVIPGAVVGCFGPPGCPVCRGDA